MQIEQNIECRLSTPAQPDVHSLARVFAVAGAAQLPDPAESVRAYRLLPEAAAHAVAYGLPLLEFALAVLLLLGLVARPAAKLSRWCSRCSDWDRLGRRPRPCYR